MTPITLFIDWIGCWRHFEIDPGFVVAVLLIATVVSGLAAIVAAVSPYGPLTETHLLN